MTFRLTNQIPIDINGDLLSNWDEENLLESIAFNCLNSKKFRHKYWSNQLISIYNLHLNQV